jgi:hypothetical protein
MKRLNILCVQQGICPKHDSASNVQVVTNLSAGAARLC